MFCYGLFDGENQIGFSCFANYIPKRKNQPWCFHANRTVIHPDYAGFGLGIRLIDESSFLFQQKKPRVKIMAKFSSIPIYKSMIKSKVWELRDVDKKMNKNQGRRKSNTMDRTTAFRDQGVTSFSFRYIGEKDGK